MKSKQIVAVLLFLVAVGLLIWWYAAGHQVWTTTQHMVEVKKVDEIFGTTTVEQQWVKQFTPGLEYIGPAVALCVLIGGWLFYRGSRSPQQ
jgi:hypothetical protein